MDHAGDVWITDTLKREIYEFGHGATTPLKKFDNPNGYPGTCAVDFTTGDVAVTESHPNGKYSDGSTVRVYPGGSAPSKEYSAYTGFSSTYFLAYDNESNLFVDAVPCGYYHCAYGSPGGPTTLYELSPGGTYFVPIAIKSFSLAGAGGLAWLNPSLLIANNGFSKKYPGALKLIIGPSGATVSGSLTFRGSKTVDGVFHYADRIIVTDHDHNAVKVYDLKTSSLISTITSNVSAPYAVAISPGQSKKK